jgi:hypothetical protein
LNLVKSRTGFEASAGGVEMIQISKRTNINATAPGPMAIDNTTALENDPVRSSPILERISAGRCGEPNDVAGAFW